MTIIKPVMRGATAATVTDALQAAVHAELERMRPVLDTAGGPPLEGMSLLMKLRQGKKVFRVISKPEYQTSAVPEHRGEERRV